MAEVPPVAAGCPMGVQGHCSQATYPEYPGFKLALVEDFDQPINLDTDPVWTYGDGALDEGQVRMTKGNVTFEGGKMRLTVKRENIPGGNSFSENKNVRALTLSSGEFRSKHNNYRYGRYEVRFKPPTSNGNFISTMFTFRTPKTVFWREVDIELTASSKTVVGTNIVVGNNQSGYGGTMNKYVELPGPGGFDNQADFHTYAFEWTQNKIVWYLDGQVIRTSDNAVPIPEKSAKIMMNLWIFAGGGFGGQNGAANVYPMYAEYDWFRFYKADGETTYPCADAPACLPAEDKLKGSKNNPTDGIPE